MIDGQKLDLDLEKRSKVRAQPLLGNRHGLLLENSILHMLIRRRPWADSLRGRQVQVALPEDGSWLAGFALILLR